MKTAILGAGISGLSVGLKLQENGESVVLYEKSAAPGGLARTRLVNGYVYDQHGGHVFNSKHYEVLDWVFSYLPKDQWTFNVRNAKIFFDGQYVSYPFELSLCELDTEHAVECTYDFLFSKQGEEPENFRDWLIWNFGNGIANYYMLPYNTKIWSYPLDEMETGWMRGKMPLPEKKDILRSLILKDPTERKMPHSTFYYPTYGGIQSMVNALASTLEIRLNNGVEKLEQRNGKWFVNGEGPYERVISTIPLPMLPAVMEMPSLVRDAIRDLKSNSLTTALFDCPQTDISWLYIPSANYRVHRVGFQSALTPHATPYGGGSGALEVIGPQFSLDADFLRRSDVLPAELKVGNLIDTEFTPYAYVIHDKNYRRNTSIILESFAQADNFYLLGRWGKWNYNNMDLCMREAFELAGRICCNDC